MSVCRRPAGGTSPCRGLPLPRTTSPTQQERSSPHRPGAQHESRGLQELLAAGVLPSLRGAVSCSSELLALSEVSLVCYALRGTCPALRGRAQVCRMTALSQEQLESWTQDKLFSTCSDSFPSMCPVCCFVFVLLLFLRKITANTYKYIISSYFNTYQEKLMP